MQEVQENNLILSKRQGRRTAVETTELAEKVGKYRLLGFTLANIGKQLGISEAQACRHFKTWTKLHEQEWRKTKTNGLVRMNETYSRRLAEAERNYVAAVESQSMQEAGFWSRHVIEVAREWREFWKDCGYLGKQDMMEAVGPEGEKEPIFLLIEEHKKYLLQRIEDARKNAVIVP